MGFAEPLLRKAKHWETQLDLTRTCFCLRASITSCSIKYRHWLEVMNESYRRSEEQNHSQTLDTSCFWTLSATYELPHFSYRDRGKQKFTCFIPRFFVSLIEIPLPSAHRRRSPDFGVYCPKWCGHSSLLNPFLVILR